MSSGRVFLYFNQQRATGLLLFVFSLLFACHARAAIKVWDGSSSGNWSTSANWTNNAAPVNGDDVVFPAASSRFVLTNNLPNLRLRSITFSGSSNYTLYGNAVTLSNGITAQQPSGRTNAIYFAITNSGAQTALVQNAGASLALNGLITGNGGLTKSGDGHMLLGGSVNNTYTGVTVVNGGVLELNDTSTATRMIPGDVVINPNSTLLLTEANQISDTANVTINGVGVGAAGLFNLNNYNETIGSLTLNNGGDVASGFGTLTVASNIFASATLNVFFDPATISGNLSLGTATRSIIVPFNPNGSPECIISANITGSGAAGLVKEGGGALQLSGTNTYPGLTLLSSGLVLAASSAPFGSSASGTELKGGHLTFLNAMVTDEWLTNSSSATILQVATNAIAGWSGGVALNASLPFNVLNNASLDLGGPIVGPGHLTKIGPGKLRFSGAVANTYTGNTTVNEGTLEFAKASPGIAAISSGVLTIGDGLGGPSADVVRYFGGQLLLGVSIVINDSGLFDLNGQNDSVGSINLIGGRIDTGAGTLGLGSTLIASSSSNYPALMFGNVDFGGSGRTMQIAAGSHIPDLFIGARLGNGGLVKTGAGSLALANSNSFAGDLTILSGEVRLMHPFATGATNSGVTVVGDGFVVLDAGIRLPPEQLYLNSTAIPMVRSASGVTNTWPGNVVLQKPAFFDVGSDGELELSGVISGPAEFIKEGEGAMRFSGALPNLFTNITTVAEGTLVLSKSAPDGAIRGALMVGDSLGLQNTDIVRYGTNVDQIADTAAVVISASGLLDFGGAVDSISSVAGDGHIVVGAGGNPAFGANNVGSIFDGSFAGGPFRKIGSGALTLNGNSTNSSVALLGGNLVVNGYHQSTINVGSGATLMGEGTVGTILSTNGGTVAPGDGIGRLTCSNVLFGSASQFVVQLNGTNVVAQYDQLDVLGTNNLGGAILKVVPGPDFAPREGQSFIILTNDGSEAIVGTFAGQPQGSVLSVGVLKFLVRYNGGSGNDVVLVYTNAPARAVAATVTGGNGDGLIQPNDCNQLSLVISNSSGQVLSNVTARLTTTTPRVIIPPAAVAYPTLPVNGVGTNNTPFALSTLPGFGCGTNINLTLVVSVGTNSFSTPFNVPTSCGTGSTFCATCPGFVTNAITVADATMTRRLARSFSGGTRCGAEIDCPGEFNTAGLYRYDLHRFTNSGPAACYTVYLDNPCGTLFASAYLGSFNSNSVCANYLGDGGDSGQFTSFSFIVPAATNFVVIVNDTVTAGAGCGYLLVVSSEDCDPALQLSRLPGNRVRLSWPTTGAAYVLDHAPEPGATNWSLLPASPIISGTNFNVTNNLLPTSRYFRLRRGN